MAKSHWAVWLAVSTGALASAAAFGGCATGNDVDFGAGGEEDGDDGAGGSGGEAGGSGSSGLPAGSTSSASHGAGGGTTSGTGPGGSSSASTTASSSSTSGGGGVCGDSVCNGNETCQSCPGDCGPCGPICGDLACDGNETCQSCPGDCGPCGPVCGDFVCDGNETCQSCAADCGACPGGCAHDVCAIGVALAFNCDPCVASVCAADDYCCTTEWDELCVDEVATYCGGISCGGPGSCAHDVCVEGVALDYGCDPCVDTVCFFDDFCCSTSWDSYCVDEAVTYCGALCP